MRLDLHDGDVVLVTSKIVSKAEGRVRSGDRAAAIVDETVRVVARRGPTSIVENRLGIVMAAAGVDASNVTPGHVVLLPEDPDASARALRQGVYDDIGRNVAVILTDTAGRAWRTGQTDLAVGVAGIEPLDDLAGMTDSYGNRLEVTAPAVADELAAVAELVTGKLGGRPISVVRGLAGRVLPAGEHGPGARALLRPRAEDMFALGAREAVVAAVRGRDGDCFGTPGTTEEVQRAMESCGLAAEVDGVSVRVRLPQSDERSGPATRSWRSSGSAWSPMRTGGDRTATRTRRTVRGTTSRSHRRLRRLQAPRDPICEGGRVVKKSERDSRRAIAEQLRQEQARKERRRSLLILGTCVVVVLGLLGTAVFVYVQDLREEKKNEGTPLAQLGVDDRRRRL